MTDIVALQWIFGVVAILAAGVVGGKIIYVLGGAFLDVLDEVIENGGDE